MGGGKGHHGPGPAYNSLDVRVLLQPGGMTLHPPKLPWCSQLPVRVPQPSRLPATPLPPGEHTWSGPPQNLSTSLIGYRGCPVTLAPPELPRRISPGEKSAVTAPVAASSSCYACSCTLAAGTMQHPRLLLFLLLLLPGTWADPEGKWEPWLNPTCSHPCTAGPHRGGRGWAQAGHCPPHQGATPHPTAPKGAPSLPTCSGFPAPHHPAQPSTNGVGAQMPEQPRGKGFLSQAWGPGLPSKTPSSCRKPAGSRGSQPLMAQQPCTGLQPLEDVLDTPLGLQDHFSCNRRAPRSSAFSSVKQHLKVPPAAISLHLHPQPVFPIPGAGAHHALARGTLTAPKQA